MSLLIAQRTYHHQQLCNNFYLGAFKQNECKPLYFGKFQIGLVRKNVEKILQKYESIFHIRKEYISIVHDENISSKIDYVLREIKGKYPHISALQGWRDENYNIKAYFSDSEPLLKMERSATCLFGLRQYGVDINGYVKHPEKGRWDNFVGGGLSEGFGIFETAIKEANEEANVPNELAQKNATKRMCLIFL
ncbi:unnamed protein product [Lepeophtheirus salmonis]|uniref:(salmon louse) hypothetical protein n=1 Tax=Lepeophtheirus salmonis TaxID=72036 RepID=A0A7R8H6B0_LEPSM|nr:unnamed protein product [Lepeophtheirus salmonis]CAF2896201.1 unnamed protein product [Lepeophtheirus salmonis]